MEFYRAVTISDIPNALGVKFLIQTKKDDDKFFTSYQMVRPSLPDEVYIDNEIDLELANWLIQWFSLPEFLASEFGTLKNEMSGERRVFLTKVRTLYNTFMLALTGQPQEAYLSKLEEFGFRQI